MAGGGGGGAEVSAIGSSGPGSEGGSPVLSPSGGGDGGGGGGPEREWHNAARELLEEVGGADVPPWWHTCMDAGSGFAAWVSPHAHRDPEALQKLQHQRSEGAKQGLTGRLLQSVLGWRPGQAVAASYFGSSFDAGPR